MSQTISTSKGTLTLKTSQDLKALSPQDLSQYLIQIEQAKQALEVDISVSQAKLTEIQAKLDEVKAQAQAEFGAQTLEELFVIRDKLLSQIDAALNPEKAPQGEAFSEPSPI